MSKYDHLPAVNRETWGNYKYRDNVPLEGLMIDGKPALTGIDPEKVGDYVLVFVRDPLCAYDDDPATQLSQRLEDPVLVGKTGMFTTWSGHYKGAHVTAISGGSGSPEAELCMVEFLEHTKASTYLRVGGSGGTNEQVRPGDLVIAKGIVRADGLSATYVDGGWPAVCSPDVVMALAEAAQALGARYHIGLTRSSDSDFIGGGRPSVRGYLRPQNAMVVDECRRTGVLNGDREASGIVTLATLFGKRGGSVCSVADNIATGEVFKAGAGHNAAIDVALEGVALLARMDRARDKAGAPYWLPSMGLAEA
ncbi:nucleoside phosphorylase [Kaistia dalseonensis]|uniref:Uridine phosphorylase n=1 Tax=Kaistia dalseonensis TaxID=410840 RepID=A0ABU0H3Z1_9HYPH|nr:nucleoside phosphorylase [Kaistia dalseonensis]MCX5494025.1 nucleoside phosphorylase [Kaistia dalseonensis]MDQ0436603.1 uridine phosphorylase [Kaistia dalseonensis]